MNRERGGIGRVPLVISLAGVLLFAAASEPARADARGDYESVPLRPNESPLLRTANDYEELFVRRGYRYCEPELEAAVERVGARLAPAPVDAYVHWRFHILRDVEANAFALPDGQIYLNSGLLALLNNEAQMAAVMAHEIQHVAGHHGILRYRSKRAKRVTGAVLGPLTLGISDVFLELSMFGYSRELEEEADLNGVERLFAAGYDPDAMSTFLEILLRDPEGESPKRSRAWSTHPELGERIELARAAARRLTEHVDASRMTTGEAAYRTLARRVSLETVQDLIGYSAPRSAVVLAGRLVQEKAGDAWTLVALGDAQRALGPRGAADDAAPPPTNRDKNRNLRARVYLTREEIETKLLATPGGRDRLRHNLEEARASYQRALAIDSSFPEAHRGMGYALFELEQWREAGREFVIYLRARSDAPDKPIILKRLQEINDSLKTGDSHEP